MVSFGQTSIFHWFPSLGEFHRLRRQGLWEHFWNRCKPTNPFILCIACAVWRCFPHATYIVHDCSATSWRSGVICHHYSHAARTYDTSMTQIANITGMRFWEFALTTCQISWTQGAWFLNMSHVVSRLRKLLFELKWALDMRHCGSMIVVVDGYSPRSLTRSLCVQCHVTLSPILLVRDHNRPLSMVFLDRNWTTFAQILESWYQEVETSDLAWYTSSYWSETYF